MQLNCVKNMQKNNDNIEKLAEENEERIEKIKKAGNQIPA